jgi:hypothetical protein
VSWTFHRSTFYSTIAFGAVVSCFAADPAPTARSALHGGVESLPPLRSVARPRQQAQLSSPRRQPAGLLSLGRFLFCLGRWCGHSAWKKFLADPEWIRIKKTTTAQWGDLVDDVQDRSLDMLPYMPKPSLVR